MKPYLLDTTLRDGEQAPGVVFSLKDKLLICSLLDKAGLPEIEAGTPAMGANEIEDIKTICRQGFKFKTLSWCRALKADIDKAILTGTNGVHISFPVSEIHLNAMGKAKGWIYDTMKEILPYAHGNFEYVSVGAQDASRTDIKFLESFVRNAEKLCAVRVRIADTVGILNPFSTYELIHRIKIKFRIPIEFHGHNDLGMAAANSLAAIKAGAEAVSVTVNGIGERAGNAALEEVALALELSENINMGINKEVFDNLSQVVSNAASIPLHLNKPITGKNALLHESGIHTNLLLKDRSTYQIITASSIGKEENDFILGKHSGKNAVKNFLRNRNILLSEEESTVLTEAIKQKAQELKRNLSYSEIFSLIQ